MNQTISKREQTVHINIYHINIYLYLVADLASKTFVLIHTDYFFKEVVGTNKLIFFPAEYAVSIFSLEHGIQETQNIIVSAAIPLGYKREAMERCKQVHGIPVEYAGGYKSFAEMYEKLVSFLSPYIESNKYPPFYTTNDHLMPVRSLLERLCLAASEYISCVTFLRTIYDNI